MGPKVTLFPFLTSVLLPLHSLFHSYLMPHFSSLYLLLIIATPNKCPTLLASAPISFLSHAKTLPLLFHLHAWTVHRLSLEHFCIHSSLSLASWLTLFERLDEKKTLRDQVSLAYFLPQCRHAPIKCN